MTVVTSAGAVEVVAPRVNDRRGSTSMIFGVFRHYGGRIAGIDPVLRGSNVHRAGIGDEIYTSLPDPGVPGYAPHTHVG